MNKLIKKLDNSILETFLNSDWTVYDYVKFFEGTQKSLVKEDYRKPKKPLLYNINFDIDDVLKEISRKISLFGRDHKLAIPYKELQTVETETVNSIVIIENSVTNNILDGQKVLEITSLLAKANEDIDKIDGKPDGKPNINDEDISAQIEDGFIDTAAATIKANNIVIKFLESENPITKEKLNKQKVWKQLKDRWNEVENLLNTKLPKSILQSIAYSNPLTAIVAQNWDLAYGTTKTAIKGAAKLAGLE